MKGPQPMNGSVTITVGKTSVTRRVPSISCAPPIRETPGYGCPACAKPINFKDRHGLLVALACCGYRPSGEESRRWLKAADALDAASEDHTGD
jgi:hypothetical protein